MTEAFDVSGSLLRTTDPQVPADIRTDPRPLWAIASKQEDRFHRLVCYRAGWIGLITRLFYDASVHWPEILPAADGDDPRITTYRVRISDLYGVRCPHYFSSYVVDDGLLSQSDELRVLDTRMEQELQELCEGTSAREIHAACALGTRLRFYTMDTHSRTMTRGLGGGTAPTGDALFMQNRQNRIMPSTARQR